MARAKPPAPRGTGAQPEARDCSCGQPMVARRYNGAVRHVGVELRYAYVCLVCDRGERPLP